MDQHIEESYKHSSKSILESYPRTKIYTVHGDPLALARPRFTTGRVWDCQKQLKFTFSLALQEQHNNEPLFTGPLHIDMVFYMPMPNISISRKVKLNNTYHIFTPDLTNLEKFAEDVATGIIYANDCIVSSFYSYKIYDNNPRTDIIVTELKGFQLVMKKEFVVRGE
jgi:Holliday junction resolvase RusA-like endonuclease